MTRWKRPTACMQWTATKAVRRIISMVTAAPRGRTCRLSVSKQSTVQEAKKTGNLVSVVVASSKIPKAPATMVLCRRSGESKIPKPEPTASIPNRLRGKKTNPAPTKVKGCPSRERLLKRATHNVVPKNSQKNKEVERPRRKIERIESKPDAKKKSSTAQKSPKYPQRKAQVNCRAAKLGKQKDELKRSMTNKSPRVAKTRTDKKQKQNNGESPRVSNAPRSTLLKLCESMKRDMDSHEEQESSKRPVSDFIDQCLAFSKECDEATGRTDRLLEELSLMRSRSRSSSQASQSLTLKERYSVVSRQSSVNVGRRICRDVVRENVVDSPMDVPTPTFFDFHLWSQRQTDRLDRSMDATDREALSKKEMLPNMSGWMQELTEKSTSRLELPLHVELKVCLERMAKLELENRALKELLMIKCGVSDDSGIESLLRMSMTDRAVVPSASHYGYRED